MRPFCKKTVERTRTYEDDYIPLQRRIQLSRDNLQRVLDFDLKRGILKQYEVDQLKLYSEQPSAYAFLSTVHQIRNTNDAFNKVCDTYNFWLAACGMFDFDRTDRITGFHNVPDPGISLEWKKQFYKWSKLQHTDKTLKDAVKNLLDQNSDGSADLENYGPIGTWDTSNVRNMNNLFYERTLFDQDIGEWDTSRVTSMASMFQGAQKFNQHISLWDVSKVDNMINMFNGASSFSNLGYPLNWRVKRTIDIDYMFTGSSFDKEANWKLIFLD